MSLALTGVIASPLLTLWVVLLVSTPMGCAAPPVRKPVSDDELLVRENFSFSIPARLSSDQVSEDISLLIYGFKNAYGGRKYISSPEFETALTDLKRLETSNESNPSELCERIAWVLGKLPDNHLSARLNGRECDKKREMLFRNGGNVGKNLAKSKAKPWEVNYRVINKKRIPIISITAFPKYEDEVWKGFLEAVLAAKKSAPAIIIDLRGNGGGDDTMGLSMASYLYGQDFRSPVEYIVKSQTPATLAIAANSSHLRILRMRLKGEKVPEYMENLFQNQLARLKDAKSGAVPTEAIESGAEGKPFDPSKAYTKPIYLLVDRGCASSCESTLEAFEAHPYAMTVGENTGGFLHFGNMGQVALPNSKIIVQMATDFWKRRNGQFLEKIGYSPKIRVPAGQDALEHALKNFVKSGR